MSLLKLNTPTIYLLVLAIIILTLSSIYFYIDYRLKLQTQKINSVASLASTLAEELHNIKLVLSISPDVLNSVVSQEKKSQATYTEEIFDGPRNISLIDVSDDDNTIDDSDTQSSSSSDDAGSDCDADTDSEMEEPTYGGSIVINESKNNEEPMVILEKIFVKVEETVPINDAVQSNENTKVVQCSDFKDIEKNTIEELSNDISPIDVNNSDCLIETDIDYSKMPISKLRSMVVELGIISDATKLKKNELMQLLTSKI